MSQHREYVEELFESKVGRTLAEFVTEHRDKGASWRSIEREMFAASGLTASSLSLRRWYDDEERGVA